MAILRYGPWANIIPHSTQGLYQNYDAPTSLPSVIPPTGYPVNCAKTDWASGAAWSSLSEVYSDFDPIYFYEGPYYEEKPINTQISDTANIVTALCRFSFHYQATADFTISMEWTCNSIGFGSWYYQIISLDENSDKVTDQQLTQFGDGVTTSYSGTETLNIPASTIGTVTCFVDNFGSDYPGDTCTLKIY